jgi:hypothetical protein
MIVWGVIIATAKAPLFHSLTADELNETIWAHTGPLSLVYGLGIPLAALVAGIGILLHSGAKGSTVWKVGIGLFVVFVIAFFTYALRLYSPVVFGIGGTTILLSFTGILWLWAKERRALSGSSATAADLRLASYVLFFMAAWFI